MYKRQSSGLKPEREPVYSDHLNCYNAQSSPVSAINLHLHLWRSMVSPAVELELKTAVLPKEWKPKWHPGSMEKKKSFLSETQVHFQTKWKEKENNIFWEPQKSFPPSCHSQGFKTSNTFEENLTNLMIFIYFREFSKETFLKNKIILHFWKKLIIEVSKSAPHGLWMKKKKCVSSSQVFRALHFVVK